MIDPLATAVIEATARSRVRSVEGYQSVLRSRYRRLHHYAYPLNGDQWPEDVRAPGRAGKIHVTANICKPLVEIDARLQSLVPRVACKPNGVDTASRRAAEEAEKVIQTFLELSDWDLWLNTLAKTKAVYGKGVLKPFWNTAEKRPDVIVVEDPGNLILGWGSSDFRVLDFAVYSYGVSMSEAKRRWPEATVERVATGGGTYGWRVTQGSDHGDPAGQRDSIDSGKFTQRDTGYTPSDYEGDQLHVWDYWWLDEDDTVRNAILLEGTVVAGPFSHPELPDIPYIPIENEHEPGSPEGVATHEPILDIQVELDRLYSHWAQMIADEIDPSWQLTGENADSVPPGIVPRAGQIVPAGAGNRIEPISKGVNTFPVEQLADQFWGEVHRITGLPQVLFGTMPGAQTAGRALAVQVEAASNRLDPKRRLLYAGIKRLILFWVFMLEKQNPKIKTMRATPPAATAPGAPPSVMEQQNFEEVEIGLGDVVRGFRRWNLIAPEITPRDAIESTTNTINQVQARLISLDTARDQLGYDSPADEGEKVENERQNINLFPGDVQTRVAVITALNSLQQQQMQQEQMQAAMAAASDQRGQAASTAQAQQATPALSQSANEGPPQPMTQAGGPPPGGPAVPQATQQTLIRADQVGGAKALNQIAMSSPIR